MYFYGYGTRFREREAQSVLPAIDGGQCFWYSCAPDHWVTCTNYLSNPSHPTNTR